jgi:hypothetical protein
MILYNLQFTLPFQLRLLDCLGKGQILADILFCALFLAWNVYSVNRTIYYYVMKPFKEHFTPASNMSYLN